MFQKLEAVENRYEELNKKIADPEVIANTSEWTKFMKEHAEIEEYWRSSRNAKWPRNERISRRRVVWK